MPAELHILETVLASVLWPRGLLEYQQDGDGVRAGCRGASGGQSDQYFLKRRTSIVEVPRGWYDVSQPLVLYCAPSIPQADFLTHLLCKADIVFNLVVPPPLSDMVCGKVGGAPDHCGGQNTTHCRKSLYPADVGVFHLQELPSPTVALPPPPL